jgi:hypothetical protein
VPEKAIRVRIKNEKKMNPLPWADVSNIAGNNKVIQLLIFYQRLKMSGKNLSLNLIFLPIIFSSVVKNCKKNDYALNC